MTTSNTTQKQPHGDRAPKIMQPALFQLFGAFFCFFAIVAPLGQIPSDTLYSVETAKSLYYRHTISINPTEQLPDTKRGLDGLHYSKYGIGYALSFLPFIALADLTHRTAGIERFLAERLILSFTNCLYAALMSIVLLLLLKGLGYPLTVCVAAVVLTSFCSIMLPYSKIIYAEIPTALLLLLFLLIVTRHNTVDAITGVKIGALANALYLLKIANILYMVPIICFILYSVAKKRATPAGVAACAIFTCASLPMLFFLNSMRFGNFLNFGYGSEQAQFTTSIFHGLYGLLFSPAKSIFVYSPFLIPALFFLPDLYKRNPTVTLLIVISSLTSIVFYAGWHDWHGGWCWGPRLIVPAMILLHIPVAGFIQKVEKRLAARVMFFILLIPALIVQILGTTINYQQIHSLFPDPTRIDAPYFAVASRLFMHKAVSANEHYLCTEFPVDCERLLRNKSFAAYTSGDSLFFDVRETFRGFNLLWAGLAQRRGSPWPLLAPVALLVLGMALFRRARINFRL